MPLQVVQLPNFVTPTTSSTYAGMSSSISSLWSTVSGLGIGQLDDAGSITIFITTSAAGLTSGTTIQISQFDPAKTFPDDATVQSSQWFTYTLTTTTAGVPLISSGSAYTINNVSFRGIRLSMLGSANTANEVIAVASKQITV